MADTMNISNVTLTCKFEKDLVDALREAVDGSKWQCVGSADEYLDKKCTVLYAINEDPSERYDNIAVFNIQDRLYAIETVCPHEGGPLELGDIEDLDGGPVLYCPWHHYDFNLVTGKSSTGLEQQTYEVRIVDNQLYIKTDIKLTRTKSDVSSQGISPTSSSSLISSSSAQATVVSGDINTSGVTTDTRKSDDDSLCYWAVRILSTANPDEKVNLTYQVAERWESGDLVNIGHYNPPDQPSRTESLKVVAAGKTKRLGKAGSLGSRISLIHSLANIEQWAIDLSWDIIARFSHVTQDNGQALPREFFSDWVKVARDEAKHYKMLSSRLQSLGSYFGDLPVHNGLWESAQETSHNLLSRLAIVHMVHEARGLDVHPKTYRRFLNGGDKETAELLEILYKDEITHVAAGIKWFSYLCDSSSPTLDKIPTFHELVKKHFRGYLKPPFDTPGREKAGMTEDWYIPLVKPS